MNDTDTIETPDLPEPTAGIIAASVAEQPTDEAPPPEPASLEPEPTHQTFIGHPISVLTADHVLQLEFIRDFVQGVPYAVDAVNAAKAG